MVTFIALYRAPPDVETFERRYFDEHLPLVRRFPGLHQLEVNRATSLRENSPFYLIAELIWDDRDAMRSTLRSEVSQQADALLQKFAGDIITMPQTETLELYDPESEAT